LDAYPLADRWERTIDHAGTCGDATRLATYLRLKWRLLWPDLITRRSGLCANGGEKHSNRH